VSSPPIGISASMPSRGDAEGVLAADRDQRLDAQPVQRREHAFDAALDAVGVRARRTEHRAAARQDPADGVQVQRHRVALEHPSPAVPEPDDLVVVLADPLADDGPDDGVEARAVAAAGQDADAHAFPPGSGGVRTTLLAVMMPQLIRAQAGRS
jgi:hypothetical protein